MMHDVWPDE